VSAPTEARPATSARPLTGTSHEDSTSDRVYRNLLRVALFFSLFFLVVLFGYILTEGLQRFDLDLVRNQFSQLNPDTAGAQAAILGTIYLGILVTLITVPLGVAAATYLEEYADKTTRINRIIDLNIQNLAAVPSVVYGLLGLGIFVQTIFGGPYLIVGALTLSLLVLPVVIISSREAIKAVPPSLREGSLGLGATQWQTTWRMTLPNAIPGIATGTILAVSRAIGEAAPLIILGVGLITFNPGGLFDRFTALPIVIFDTAKRPQEAFQELSASLIIIALILLLILNGAAILIRNKFTKRW
jgi:phosphate transport system permease protein